MIDPARLAEIRSNAEKYGTAFLWKSDVDTLFDTIYALLPILDDVAKDRGAVPQDSLPAVQLLAEVARLRKAIEEHREFFSQGNKLEADRKLWAALEKQT